MIAITTVYVSLVEPEDESGADGAKEPVKMEDLRRTIEDKLLAEPDENRTLVTVHAGACRASSEGN